MEDIKQCFLPKFIEQKYQQKIKQGEFKGSALFVDINNFTAKTEQLFKQGDQGAEEISQFLVNIFDLPIKATYLNRGFVSGFAGDAFLAIFPGDKGERLKNTLEIIASSIISNENLGNAVKLGTGVGNIRWGIVGNHKFKTYYFSGPGIDQSVNSKIEDLNRFNQGNYDPDMFSDLIMETCSQQSMEVFFSHSLIKYHIQPELRYIIPVFANFGKHSEFDFINELVSQNFSLAQSCKGFFNKLEVGDKGSVTLTVFGAPESKEYSEILAISFAQQIRNHFPQVKIGMDFGLAYTGLTGNYFRNEWTVIGDVVNCASRLMTSANAGEILLSERFKHKSMNLFELTDIGSKLLKGKTRPEKIYRFEKVNRIKNVVYPGPFLGRNKEINKIKKFMDNRFKYQKPGIINLWGEAGIGKTRLVNEIISRNISPPLNWILLKGDQSINYPWNPLQLWLKELLAIQDDSRSPVEQKISDYLDKLSSWYKSYWSYLAAVCGYRRDNTVFEQVDEKTRVENQNFILTQILDYLCRKQSTVLVIDDYQWTDELTRSWLAKILANPQFENLGLTLFLITPQPSLDISITPDSPNLKMQLGALNHGEIKQLIESMLNRKLPSETVKSIVNRVQGNPFFAEQLVLSIRDRDLEVESEPARLPSSLSEILTARIDRLNPDTRELIKTCSVLGDSFDSNLLRNLIQWEKNKLETATYDAIDQGVLRLKENHSLLFSQNLLQQAAYQLLLPSDRIKLHCSAVEIIENSPQFDEDKNIGLLYSQAKKSELKQKWIKYAEKYSQYLKDHYANLDAMKVYQELSDYYQSHSMLIKYYETNYNIAKIHLHIGNFNQAKEILSDLKDGAPPEIKSKTIFINILNNLAEAYFRLGDFDTAETLVKQTIKLGKEINHRASQINSQILLAVTLQSKNEFDQAISTYQKLLPLVDEDNFGEEKIRTLLNLSGLYTLIKKYDLAQDYLQRCLEDPQIKNNLSNMVMAHNNMGIIEINSGKPQQALVHFKNALNITEKIGSLPYQAAAKHNIGKLYLDLGDKKLAEQYFQESLEMHRIMSIKHGELQNLISLGVVHEENLEKAMKFYRSAKQLAEQYGYLKELLMIEVNTGDAYQLAGQTDRALATFKSALKQAEESEEKNFIKIISGYIQKIERPE